MAEYGYPILFALFIWWFSTGAIMYLDGLPRSTFKWSLLGATVVLAASLWGLGATAADASVWGAYAAFTCGLLAWGWQEISFYMGYVTGPRKEVCPEGCSGWKHFVHAIETSLWHELAIVVAAVAVVALTWEGNNHIGLWTFMILWWMHQSAKLNVFLGVRNLNEEFLPEHLAFLKGFLTKRPMNLLFPVSVTVSTVITTMLAQAALVPAATPFEVAGYTFLATLMALAVLEHWFLVLPLPAAKLWSWGLASRAAETSFDVDIAVGFLGAGKTTFLRRLLDSGTPGQRTVALVNDFAELGIDASMFKGCGADVVELANGCICCSLRKDLAQQLEQMAARYAPERVIIEPSGVADVAALMAVLHRPEISALVRDQRLYTVIDAGAFLADYARMPEYFEAQADLARVFIVNKTDLVSPADVAMVAETLRALNPRATIVPASFGVPSEGTLDAARAAQQNSAGILAHDGHAAAEGAHHQHSEPHAHDDHEASELGFESFSARLDRPCDAQSLDRLLGLVVKGDYGQVERLKGIVKAGSGWLRFDVAGGRARIAAFAPAGPEEPRVMAIGRAVDQEGLLAGFAACSLRAAA